MPSTHASRRDVYQSIAQHNHYEWPVYPSTPLYDRSSLGGLTEDIRTVASIWFDCEAHESVDAFTLHYPLEYIDFDPHDHYSRSNRYEMSGLFRVFLLKELHGWDHETALVEYLNHHPDLCERLNLETIPDQSTLWRNWHRRFTTEFRDTIKTAAGTILLQADRAGVSVPREPPDTCPRYQRDEAGFDDRSVLGCAKEVTDHVSRIVYPGFSLDRGEGCEIHEHAFWDLQTYLGLRERLSAN